MKSYDTLGNGAAPNSAPSAPPPPYDFTFGSQTLGAPPPPSMITTGQYVSAPPLRQTGHDVSQPYHYGRTAAAHTTIHIARPLAAPVSTYHHRREDSDCCCCCCSCPFWVCCLIMALHSDIRQ